MLDVASSTHGNPFCAQDRLCRPDQLNWKNGLVEFVSEYQGNWTAACEYGGDDPPVFSNAADLWEDTPQGVQQVCDTLDHFLITFSLQEAVLSSRWMRKLDVSEKELKVKPEPLWLDGYYVWNEPSHWFYTVAEGRVLLMNEFTSGLWAGSIGRDPLGGIHWAGSIGRDPSTSRIWDSCFSDVWYDLVDFQSHRKGRSNSLGGLFCSHSLCGHSLFAPR